MDEDIRSLLESEIKEEIRALSALDDGSNEKSMAIDDLAKLYKLRIEEIKAEWDFDEKYNRRIMEDEQNRLKAECEAGIRERDEQLRIGQLEEQIKDRYFRFGAEAAGIVLPMIFYWVWMKRGFRFEETGTYTSTTFRGLFNRFKPTKK
jgi:hypothetical protein